MKTWQVGLILLLLLAAFTIASGVRHATIVSASVKPAARPAPHKVAWAEPQITPDPKVVVALRLDPTLTRGLYLGDRWVSPPTYFFAQPGTEYVVQAKAQYVDRRGETVNLRSEWRPTDLAMVSVIHRKANEVTLVVHHPGTSNVAVATGMGDKMLRIRARQVDDAMQVEINQ
jgi:hypothetical protein